MRMHVDKPRHHTKAGCVDGFLSHENILADCFDCPAVMPTLQTLSKFVSGSNTRPFRITTSKVVVMMVVVVLALKK